MLERAVASGRAPTLELLIERGQHVDDCVAAFPSVTPVCAASIATGTGPDEHEIPAMNWYHRGEQRYVEYGTSFRASQSFGLKQSLTDTIYNMNLEHLSKDVRDGVRAARRRRRAHRRHDVPDVPRPPPPRGVGRHRADADRAPRSSATRSTARASSSTPTSSPRAGRRAARSSACRGSATSTPAASASTWSSTTCSTSCCFSLPDNDTHSHKNGPFAQVDSLAAADRQLERLMAAGRRPGRVPRRPRGDRLLGPLAVARGGGDRPVPRVRRLRRAARRPRPRRRRRDRGVPELARRAGLRARPRPPPQAGAADRAHAARRSRASTSCCA